jgi:diguanylate cyclase (GGDEF)-like protein/PAS domain S-box-containing protein
MTRDDPGFESAQPPAGASAPDHPLRSRQFVQSVLDGLAAHLCVLDERGVIVTVNRAWREFATANGGLTHRVLEGASYRRVCEQALRLRTPDAVDIDTFLLRLDEVLAGRRRQFEFEYPCHSSTEQRWFIARVARVEGNGPLRIVVAHDDVTQLKQAQEALRQGQDLLLDLAASIPGALFRVQAGGAGRWNFQYLSPGLQTLLEVSPEEGVRDAEAVWGCVLAEDRRAHESSIREAIARGSAWDREFRIRSRSGQVRWIHAQAQPKPGADGRPIWTGMLTDVSDRKHVETVLQASEETYRTLFETVPQGVIYQDPAGRITAANPAALRILGLPLGQLMGRTADDARWHAIREDGSDFPAAEQPAMQTLRTGLPVKDVVMGVQVPGRGCAWILMNANPVYKDGRLNEVYTSFEDITPRVLLSNELRQQATTDFLTGAANRRSLMERLNSELERVGRHPELRCSVLAMDLDHFKQVNDTWGHAAGDAVLQHVTQLMQQETRQLDLLGRTGGEEFTLLLPDTETDEALALAERLRARVQQAPLRFGAASIPITVSIGVSTIAAADANADAALVRADRALYAAKNGGRNQVRLAPQPG